MPVKRTRRRRAISGKGRWRAGVDTCVMNPVVACKDGQKPRGDQKDYVSRIVDIASADAVTEEVLRTNFPLLAQHRLISVSELSCRPAYNMVDVRQHPEADINDEYAPGCRDKGINGYYVGTIQQQQRHLNLVTPKVGSTLWSDGFYLNPSISERVKALKASLFASVCLVPDAGPWVVHLDLHMKNVLMTIHPPEDVDFGIGTFKFDGTTTSVMADWGRVLIFENLDDATVISKLRELGQPGGYYPYSKFDDQVYLQHPRPAMELLDIAIFAAYNENRVSLRGKNGIRGLVPFVLFYQALHQKTKMVRVFDGTQWKMEEQVENPGYIGKPETQGIVRELLLSLLRTSNQGELMEAVGNVYNTLLNGTDVFPVKQEEPECGSPAKEAVSAEAIKVVEYRGGPEGSAVVSKEEASCSVKTTIDGTPKYIKLWLPPTVAQRTRLQSPSSETAF